MINKKMRILVMVTMSVFMTACTNIEKGNNYTDETPLATAATVIASSDDGMQSPIAIENLVEAYARYLNNEITADYFGDKTLREYFLSFCQSVDEIPEIEQFCIYDWDGDGVPELYFYHETQEGSMQSINSVYLKNGYLYNDSNLQSWVRLRDDGVLFKSAPTLEGHYYWWWSYRNGIEIYASAACYDRDHDGEWDEYTLYDVDKHVDKEVSESEWEEFIVSYFEEGTQIVEWVMWKDFDEWYKSKV